MWRVLAVLVMLAGPLGAQTYPTYDRTTIIDRADLLSDAQEVALDARLAGLRRDIGIAFAVLTLRSQFPHNALSLEDFARGLFDEWGIGDATRNDGILVLVLSEDRAMRIELGAAYGRDWNDEAADIIDRSFLPAFGDDAYAKGIQDGVEDVIASIALPFHDGADAPPRQSTDPLWLILTVFAGIGVFAARRKIGDVMTRFKTCPNCGRRSLSRQRSVVTRATLRTDGHGVTLISCSQCGFEDSVPFVIPMQLSSSFDDSDGGSFGGGSSGGGGASGRW